MLCGLTSCVLVSKPEVGEKGYVAVATLSSPARSYLFVLLTQLEASLAPGRSYLPCWRRCHRVLFNIFLCFFFRIFLRLFFTTDDTQQPFVKIA
jgi:hypothetical protein